MSAPLGRPGTPPLARPPAGHHRSPPDAYTAAHESGQISVYLVLTTVALLAVLGLAVDGGSALAARGRAADLAAQASRAGADAATLTSLRSGDPTAVQIDPGAATAAASTVLAAAGATGTVTVTGPDQVSVRADLRRPTAIWSIIGIDQIHVHAEATAVSVHGTSTGQR